MVQKLPNYERISNTHPIQVSVRDAVDTLR